MGVVPTRLDKASQLHRPWPTQAMAASQEWPMANKQAMVAMEPSRCMVIHKRDAKKVSVAVMMSQGTQDIRQAMARSRAMVPMVLSLVRSVERKKGFVENSC